MRSFIRIDKEIAIHYSLLSSSDSLSPRASRLSTSCTATLRSSRFRAAPNDAITKNISVLGVCFHSEQELPINKQLVVELRLPDYEAPITPLARVAWCDQSGAGYDIGLELMWFDWQTDEQLIFARYVNDKSKPYPPKSQEGRGDV